MADDPALAAALASFNSAAPTPAEEPALELDADALGSALAAFEVGEAPAAELTETQKALTPDYYVQHGEPGLQEPGIGAPAEAALGGAVKSVFETKDFIFGDTADADRSALRASIEDRTEALKQQSMLGGFSAGIGQFAAGMFGLGKITGAAQALPWFGKGLAALGGVRGGAVAGEVARAATVGAVAFDPHEERLSNLIQSTPLANPITQWLAADPTDSAAEGRMKSAMESIGLDAALIGAFAGAAKVWKALRLGDEAGAERAVADAEAEIAKAQEPEALPQGTGTPDDPIVLDEITVPRAEPEIEVSVTANPTAAAAEEGVDLAGTPNPAARPRVEFTDEDTLGVLNGAQRDADAMEAHGGWAQAIQAGHTFGKGESIPYGKLNSDDEVAGFMARAVDAVEERLVSIKGGDVLTDASVSRMIAQRAKLFGDEPATVIGMLQQSGQMAARSVADMEAGYLITARMFQDTSALAQRINAGDWTQFGSREGAVEELKRRLSLASSVYGASRSITANAGRAVRRMRKDFKLRPEDLAGLKEMDGDQLVQMIVNTNGDPKALARAANPTFWRKFTDAAEFVYVNNLVSGPKTQIVNLLSNSFMVGVRPLERMLGGGIQAAMGNPEGRAAVTEAVKQYAYMGSAFVDGFQLAVKAFKLNDSVLAPQGTEYFRPNQQAGAIGPNGFKPWNSTGAIRHNALNGVMQAIGLPTRTLGFVDEIMKQTTYRSKVAAKAHVEAVAAGSEAGLKGADLEEFVRLRVQDRLDGAFDELGRGVDPEAIREAQITTFQQDLLPNTLGKQVQALTNNIPAMKLVLPFVKTPTNVIRYGWKLSPGLNLLQTEYRQMLRGSMGSEMQAQAMGQMSLGITFMGAAAFLSSSGMITGGGPSDPKLRQELMTTGWRPYSFVKRNSDGSTTYTEYGRYDPIAIPFGIIADLQDAMSAFGEEETEGAADFVGNAIGALFIGLSKQFTSKTYLEGVSQTIEALSEPETRGPTLLGQTAANFVPFSAFLRQTSTDPYLREARSVADRVLATVPGLSETVPARYDAFGDPVVARRGLWATDTGNEVDIEMQRLALVNGSSVLRVQPKPQSDVDLRDITMADGSNAYETYQQLAGHLPGAPSLKSIVGRIIETDAYRNAPDGDRSTRGTKLWMLQGRVQDYRQGAMRRVSADPNVRAALEKKQRKVLDHYQPRSGPALSPDIGAAFGLDLGGALDAERN